MKKLLFFLLFPFLANAQSISPDKNAIIHSKFYVETKNENDGNDPSKAIIDIQYFDGLGRPVQKVAYKQSPNGMDILSDFIQYDEYGRVSLKCLPTVSNKNTGEYNQDMLNLAKSFYADQGPFTKNIYDNSPSENIVKSIGVGQDWQSNGKNIQVFNEIAGTDIPIYEVDNAQNINITGYFPAHSLFKKRVIDEQGNTSISYVGQSGLLYMKQIQDAPNSYITTYYIYDDWDRVKAVLQPEAFKLNQNITFNSSVFNNWVFFNVYDHDGRLVQKKIPNAAWEYFVYDKWDRLVLSQNGLQREKGKWSFQKYDILNRLIISGEKAESRSQASLQTEAENSSLTRFEVSDNSNLFYSLNQSYPSITQTDIYQINYYDNYYFYGYDNLKAAGKLTGSLLKNGSALVNYLYFYDNKGRLLTSEKFHEKSAEITSNTLDFAGRIKNTSHTYVWSGNILFANEYFAYDNAGRRKSLDYAMFNDVEDGSRFRMADYKYDEIGRLIQKIIRPDRNYLATDGNDYIYRPQNPTVKTEDFAKKAVCLLPGTSISAQNGTYLAQISDGANFGKITGMQTFDYTYNIRGGLKSINDAENLNKNQNDLWAMKLEYQENQQYFDGNIAKQSWTNKKDGYTRNYYYSYDKASRLLNGTYINQSNPSLGENYSISNLQYDKNGNILSLNRKGLTCYENCFGDIDKLTYNYGTSGNQLVGVTDAVSGNADTGDFRDNNSDNDYTYWSDGSLKSDGNKGISLIEYDSYLKLNTKVTWANNNWIQNYYLGDGTKYKKVSSDGSETLYLGDALFEKKPNATNFTLTQINNDEGRSVFTNGKYIQEYNYTDHLGNLRLSFADTTTTPKDGIYSAPIIISVNDSDPFGLRLSGLNYTRNSNNFNKFDLQGHERDGQTGWIDFGARIFDPQVPRFLQIDPLSGKNHSISGYNFAFNNPVRYIDLFGLDTLSADSPDKAKKGDVILFGNGSTATASADEVTVRATRSNNYGWENRAINNWSGSSSGNTGYLNNYQWNKAYNGYNNSANIASGLEDYLELEANIFSAGWSIAEILAIKGIQSLVIVDAAKGGTSLVKTGTQWSKHSLQRLAERGVTQDMAELAISKGQKFYDPLNKSINYVLPNGFASGKSLLVGTNPLTGQVTTVLRSSKNLINSRFIPIK